MSTANEYDSNYAENFGCSHRQRVTYNSKLFCQSCGLFINDTQIKVYKTLKMRYNAFFDPTRTLQMCLNTQYPQFQLDDGYLFIRPSVIEFIIEAASRLRISMNSVFLAVFYLDHYQSNNKLAEQQVYLFAATSLMLAAKANELDERIPFISKLRRYASMTSHPEINLYRTEEFKETEQKLIKSLNWQLQRLTLLDRVEHLLAFGVLDDSDSIVNEEKGTQQVKDLSYGQILNAVKDIESHYQQACVNVLKDKMYLDSDQKILSLVIVGYLRKRQNLQNIWSDQLNQLSDVSIQHLSSKYSEVMEIMGKNPPRLFASNFYSYINEQALPLSNYNSITNIRSNHPKSNSTLYTSSTNNLKRNSRNHYTYLNLNENHYGQQSNSYLLEDKKFDVKMNKYLNDQLPLKNKRFRY